jgi:hypothetical protein
MKKEEFDTLVASIREAGRVRRGKSRPSRVIEFAPVDVKAIRGKPAHSGSKKRSRDR